jgi:Zn-dependent oligopeptidase
MDNIPTSSVRSDYRSAADPPTSTSSPPATSISLDSSDKLLDSSDELLDAINSDPAAKRAFEEIVETLTPKDDEETFSIAQILHLLIELSQVMQTAAIAYAERLTKITEKMNEYTTLQKQVPMISREVMTDQADRDQYNSLLTSTLDIIRTNKGIEEDKSKKITTLMQGLKDGGASMSDILSGFIDLIRGISAKIMQ